MLACERKLDLCVLLDGSSTICNGSETCLKWNSTLQFSKDFVSSFKIGPDDTKVALATIGDKFNKEWNLNGYVEHGNYCFKLSKYISSATAELKFIYFLIHAFKYTIRPIHVYYACVHLDNCKTPIKSLTRALNMTI